MSAAPDVPATFMALDRFAFARRSARWRSMLADTLVWALRLAGWIGLASLAQVMTSGPLPAFLLMAVWLGALGTLGNVDRGLGRLASGRLRHASAIGSVGLLVSVSVSVSLVVSVRGGGALWLVPAMVAWAALVGLAAAAVERCAAVERPAPARSPVGTAAVGAALAWVCLGDIGDVQSLVTRLTGLVWVAGAIVCALLAPGLPRTGVASEFARPPDCSLPDWSAARWRHPRRWPVGLASFAMLPMMCSLPWMVSLCRSDSVGAVAVLAVHLAAMFLPATVVAAHAGLAARADVVCGLALALGAGVWVLAPGGGPWAVLATTQGVAWSVSWAARSQAGGPVSCRVAGLAGVAWRGALLNAVCCLALGAGMTVAGLQALAAWPVALGVAAVLSFGGGGLFAPPADALTSARARRGRWNTV